MDISTSYKLTTQLLALFVLFSIAAVPAQAQERNLDRELLVYILPDSLEIPAEVQERASIDEAEIGSNTLYTALREIQINHVERAFPEWEAADSVRVLESGRVVHRPAFHRVFIMHMPHGISSDEAVERLEKEPSVMYAHPHMSVQLETDTYYTDQWHLNNTGQAGGTAGADIRAEQAWNIFTGSSDIKIGIFDSGVDLNHVDLDGKATGDPHDFSTTNPASLNHGTHVAGIAAGKANNQNGLIRGVDWNAQIVSKAINDGDGGWLGDNNFASKLADAVDNDGVHVLNHSWGDDSSSFSVTVHKAFAYAYNMNRVSVTSAGNQGLGSGDLTAPASYGYGIIAVGATRNNDSRSPASSFGSKLNVVAPGGTNIGGTYNNQDIMSAMIGNDADFMAGTSMASPIVAGIASLLKGYNNDLYNDDIQRIIELSADKTRQDLYSYNSDGWNNEMGYGRVNAYEALKLLQEPYELNHYTISGGTVHSTNTEPMLLYGLPGLAYSGPFIVKKYEVRRSVSFSWMDELQVWGRGAATTGYTDNSPNFGMGSTEVINFSNNSALLRTYVYEVWGPGTSGHYQGWFPSTPENVEYAYTVHGIPGDEPLSVEISGDFYFGEGNLGQWAAVASGGEPPYSYTWFRSYSSSTGPWTQVGTSSSYGQMVNDEMWLRLSVTDNTCQGMICLAAEDVAHIEVLHCGNPPCPMPKMPGGEEALPETFTLVQNYPNPFNPATTIGYDLPERSDVRLEVYNMLGQRVALLVNEQVQAGSHTAVFDASNLSSGTYLLRMDAQGSSGTRFNRTKGMQLVK